MIKNNRVARKFLLSGILGFCESYLDGDWESPDLTALFAFALRNETSLRKSIEGNRLWRLIEGGSQAFYRNTRKGSRRNIAYHYDLGNSFYESWLDKSMTYSSALYPDNPHAGGDLAEAQTNKYHRMCQMLALKPDHHLLEIGCGWGGFAEYAAKTSGCRVTAITISQQQYDYAIDRIGQAGLSDRVEIRLCDYRDIDGHYDRIASIEMLEAVGQEYWPRYFSILHNRLRPGGIAAVQVITIADRFFSTYQQGADYIQKYIFPGGLLPTFQHLESHSAQTGLTWLGSHNFASHYARTLAEWQRRFNQSWQEISKTGFDDRFRRMWQQYLSYCEAGFLAGTIDVHQIALMKTL